VLNGKWGGGKIKVNNVAVREREKERERK